MSYVNKAIDSIIRVLGKGIIIITNPLNLRYHFIKKRQNEAIKTLNKLFRITQSFERDAWVEYITLDNSIFGSTIMRKSIFILRLRQLAADERGRYLFKKISLTEYNAMIQDVKAGLYNEMLSSPLLTSQQIRSKKKI